FCAAVERADFRERSHLLRSVAGILVNQPGTDWELNTPSGAHSSKARQASALRLPPSATTQLNSTSVPVQADGRLNTTDNASTGSHFTSIVKDLPTLRNIVIFIGVFTAFVITCLVVRVYRSGKKVRKTRKYDIITTSAERVEMDPLNEEIDEEDSTLFDVKYSRVQPAFRRPPSPALSSPDLLLVLLGPAPAPVRSCLSPVRSCSCSCSVLVQFRSCSSSSQLLPCSVWLPLNKPVAFLLSLCVGVLRLGPALHIVTELELVLGVIYYFLKLKTLVPNAGLSMSNSHPNLEFSIDYLYPSSCAISTVDLEE
ncbi:membrane protein FAM174B, partial [Anguilla anguilla]|uniref:membrane protein FAM174B n=1 Tax=Anguilla anguilla TaxID=7936 RepID=UPI0015AFA229